MAIIKYEVCDRCGQPIGSFKNQIMVLFERYFNLLSLSFIEQKKGIVIDVCVPCFKSFKCWKKG